MKAVDPSLTLEEVRGLVGDTLMAREQAVVEREARMRELMGFIKSTLLDADRPNAWAFLESRLGKL